MVWKASLKSTVFNCFLKVHREGARQSNSGNWFHKVGATAKKVLPFVEDLWASLGVATQRSLNWDDFVGYADDIKERCSNK